MRAFIYLVPVLVMLAGCLSDDDVELTVGEGQDTVIEEGDDIVAHELGTFNVDPGQCVGRGSVPDEFSDYDYQCEDVKDIGECVVMENPHLGNTYYCALCGRVGDEMLCYMINLE